MQRRGDIYDRRFSDISQNEFVEHVSKSGLLATDTPQQHYKNDL
jgi:hypothetical protein